MWYRMAMSHLPGVVGGGENCCDVSYRPEQPPANFHGADAVSLAVETEIFSDGLAAAIDSPAILGRTDVIATLRDPCEFGKIHFDALRVKVRLLEFLGYPPSQVSPHPTSWGTLSRQAIHC